MVGVGTGAMAPWNTAVYVEEMICHVRIRIKDGSFRDWKREDVEDLVSTARLRVCKASRRAAQTVGELEVAMEAQGWAHDDESKLETEWAATEGKPVISGRKRKLQQNGNEELGAEQKDVEEQDRDTKRVKARWIRSWLLTCLPGTVVLSSSMTVGGCCGL
jgi:hypothetical protein